MKPPLTSRDWFPKVAAATLPGAGLTLGVIGVLGCVSHGDVTPRGASGQFLMWLAALIWVVLLGTCFLFRSGRRAWLSLVAANIIVWSAYGLTRMLLS